MDERVSLSLRLCGGVLYGGLHPWCHPMLRQRYADLQRSRSVGYGIFLPQPAKFKSDLLRKRCLRIPVQFGIRELR